MISQLSEFGHFSIRYLVVILTAMVLVATRADSAVQQPQQAAPPIVMEGRVSARTTSEALPQSTVTLIRLHPDLPQTIEAIAGVQSVATLMESPLSSDPSFINGFLFPTAQIINVPPDVLRPQSIKVVVSDAMGKFSFSDLESGSYYLTAAHGGFVDPLIGGYSGSAMSRIVVVERVKKPPFEEVAMVAAGSISGRILDSSGQPVVGASVSANQVWYPDGRPSLNAGISATTNDRGEYRLFGLLPGDYIVGATPARTSNTPSATMFFPGSNDPQQAKAITIKEGDEVREINLNLQRTSTQLFTISGNVLNSLPDRLLNHAKDGTADRSVSRFYLAPLELSVRDGIHNSALPFLNALPAESRKNGEFEIRGVKPGAYDIYSEYDGKLDVQSLKLDHFFTGHTGVEVKNVDIRGVSITMTPGETLTAEAIIDGESQPSLKMDSLRLNLASLDSAPYEFATMLGSLAFNSMGILTRENVPEGKYRVAVAGIPSTGFIADVLQDGKSVFDDGVVIKPESNSIQIHIQLNGPAIIGTVRTPEQHPAEYVSVILVPRSERRRNRSLFKVVTTDSRGEFTISGITPESYTIFAVADRPFREPWLNADYLSRYQERALPITIGPESSKETFIELIVQ